MKQEVKEKAVPLKRQLDEFGLGFMLLELGKMQDVEKLATGLYGRAILAELAIRNLNPLASKEETSRDAWAAFQRLADVRRDFKSKLSELLSAKQFGPGAPALIDLACIAFAYSIERNGIRYDVGDSRIKGMILGELDCDRVSELFIQLGREIGLPLEAATQKEHYLVAVRDVKTKALTHFFEATMVLADASSQAGMEAVRRRSPELAKRFMMQSARDAAALALEPADKWAFANMEKGFGCLSADFSAPELLYRFLTGKPIGQEYRSTYTMTASLLRYRWEKDKSAGNLKAFKDYSDFLRLSTAVYPILGPDNERELFSLYKDGEKIFGKGKLEQADGHLPSLWKKILNPIDWYFSERG
jgi:hypothetical protein